VNEFHLHCVISADGLLINCGISFQEIADIEEEEDEDDKVSVLIKEPEKDKNVGNRSSPPGCVYVCVLFFSVVESE
jgi:hypothetical protein